MKGSPNHQERARSSDWHEGATRRREPAMAATSELDSSVTRLLLLADRIEHPDVAPPPPVVTAAPLPPPPPPPVEIADVEPASAAAFVDDGVLAEDVLAEEDFA